MKLKYPIIVILVAAVLLSGISVQAGALDHAVYSMGDINLFSTGVILGDVYSSVGDIFLTETDPSNIIDGDLYINSSAEITYYSPSQITGLIHRMEDIPFEPGSVILPETPDDLESKGDLVTTWWPSITISEDGHYESLRIVADLTFDVRNEDRVVVVDILSLEGGEIILEGSNRLFLFANSIGINTYTRMNFQGGSDKLHLFVNNGDLVTGTPMIVYGNIYLRNGLAGFLAGGTTIYGNVVVSGSSFDLNGGSSVEGVVYAPNAGVTLTGGSGIKGNLVCDNLSASGNSWVEYEECSLVVPHLGDEPQPPGDIVLDGYFDDWAGRAYLEDPVDAKHRDFDVHYWYWGTNDDDPSMYLMVERYSSNYDNKDVDYIVFIDTDNNGVYDEAHDRVVYIRYQPKFGGYVNVAVWPGTLIGDPINEYGGYWGESDSWRSGIKCEFMISFEDLGIEPGQVVRMVLFADRTRASNQVRPMSYYEGLLPSKWADRVPNQGDLQWAPVSILGRYGIGLLLITGVVIAFVADRKHRANKLGNG